MDIPPAFKQHLERSQTPAGHHHRSPLLEAFQEVDHESIDFGRTFLPGPVADAGQLQPRPTARPTVLQSVQYQS